MIFSSNNFTFNNIYSKDMNIHIVSEDSDVLNEYGVPFDIDSEENEITISFCYADNNTPLKWDYDTTVDFLGWVITDDYYEFISEDNEGIIYYLKGIGYTKRFANDMTGIIDVTFRMLSPYGYKHYIRQISKNEKNFNVYNYSNVDNAYKPVITLSEISSDSITNTTTNVELTINNLTSSDKIYIDNMMGTITDSKNRNRLNDSNRNWITLQMGLNKISVNGTCVVKVESYYPVMV